MAWADSTMPYVSTGHGARSDAPSAPHTPPGTKTPRVSTRRSVGPQSAVSTGQPVAGTGA
eukprot:2958803-Rhodomonas_salina.2